ncbi:telomere repeat-binding factor 1-like isoform X2 [Telopea speciosissima]|uniref:telomere repeat-binding factor 1-like isoform X2 n=1 Tax=Telopea speciosissima TaxID=54955 RepID=UPI001CC74BF6|nr:telomere repeat-binding factor 1-like isoform X2 [Telopea speciosissima]
MGAPKQKWTAEEEAALKAGIAKHGAGKWRTILRDPEFSSILSMRSNVDLKDKWRNMSVTAHGWGSREKARLALKRSQQFPKHDDNPMASDEEIIDAKPLALPSETLQTSGLKRPMTRLDNLILEAISTLNEPAGSNKTAIATYIEVKRKYRLAPTSIFLEGRRISSGLPLIEGRQKDSEKDDVKTFTRSQVDAELAKMRHMTAKEAAAAAARAVAEAEAAMAEAEEATGEAEAAEADAEAAQAFAEAAMMTLNGRNFSNLYDGEIMAAQGGDAGGGDIAWNHGVPIGGDKRKTQCNYCGKKIMGGGATRLKQHLAGNGKDVVTCPMVPVEISRAIAKVMRGGRRVEKGKARVQFEETILATQLGEGDGDDSDDNMTVPDDMFRLQL